MSPRARPSKFVSPPPIDLPTLLRILHQPARWRILKLLLDDEPLSVTDLARILKIKGSLVSKNLAVLREAHIVVVGRGGLYHLSPHYRPPEGERTIDFGHCIIRVGPPEPGLATPADPSRPKDTA